MGLFSKAMLFYKKKTFFIKKVLTKDIVKWDNTIGIIMVIECRNSVDLHYFDTKSSIWSQIFNENLSMPIAMNIVKIKFSKI